MKEKIYRIIEVHDSSSWASKIYNVINIIVIIMSLLPLMFKVYNRPLFIIDQITVAFFIVEYLLHLFTSDYKYPEKEGIKAYLTYPVSFMGVVDLLSILPSFNVVGQVFSLLRLFRLFRSLRVIRVFKLFRYSRSADILIDTIRNQSRALMLVASLILLYILIVALIVFNVEAETFPSFLEALYWSVMSLTTATYGNIFPTSTIGQIFSMVSLLVGVIIIVLPSSIITAGYVSELETRREKLEARRKRREEATKRLRERRRNSSNALQRLLFSSNNGLQIDPDLEDVDDSSSSDDLEYSDQVEDDEDLDENETQIIEEFETDDDNDGIHDNEYDSGDSDDDDEDYIDSDIDSDDDDFSEDFDDYDDYEDELENEVYLDEVMDKLFSKKDRDNQKEVRMSEDTIDRMIDDLLEYKTYLNSSLNETDNDNENDSED